MVFPAHINDQCSCQFFPSIQSLSSNCHANSCCHLRTVSAFSGPAGVQSSTSSSRSHSCKRTDRQSANQEHNMHSFTFLCASVPHVPDQSACPTATPVYPRGREHTEVKLPRRFLFEYLSPIPLRLTRSVQMTHNPRHVQRLLC